MSAKDRFYIYQDDDSKKTFVYEKELGWIEQPEEFYDIWWEQHETIRKYPNTFIQMMDLS